MPKIRMDVIVVDDKFKFFDLIVYKGTGEGVSYLDGELPSFDDIIEVYKKIREEIDPRPTQFTPEEEEVGRDLEY